MIATIECVGVSKVCHENIATGLQNLNSVRFGILKLMKAPSFSCKAQSSLLQYRRNKNGTSTARPVLIARPNRDAEAV